MMWEATPSEVQLTIVAYVIMIKHISTGFNYENKLTFFLEVPFLPDAFFSGCHFFQGAFFLVPFFPVIFFPTPVVPTNIAKSTTNIATL